MIKRYKIFLVAKQILKFLIEISFRIIYSVKKLGRVIFIPFLYHVSFTFNQHFIFHLIRNED